MFVVVEYECCVSYQSQTWAVVKKAHSDQRGEEVLGVRAGVHSRVRPAPGGCAWWRWALAAGPRLWW